MRIRFSNLNFLIIILLIVASAQERIRINIPSAAEEAEYVWRTIQDIHFFDQHGYSISLPQGAVIDTLLEKARSHSLTDNDFTMLQSYMSTKIYTRNDYQAAYKKIERRRPLLNQMINEIDASERQWLFCSFDTYQVNLTLYGPGGSYDPENGSILIFTTPQGDFKNYHDPANTIIHEVVHIGIETSIISKYNVPHPLKERIVDTFVTLNFQKKLPEYRVQNMGNTAIDTLVKKREDLANLAETVAKFMTTE